MGDEKEEEVTAPESKEDATDHVPPPPVVEPVKEMPPVEPEAPSAA